MRTKRLKRDAQQRLDDVPRQGSKRNVAGGYDKLMRTAMPSCK